MQVDEANRASRRSRPQPHSLARELAGNAPLDPAQIYAMPVLAHDPLAAAAEYAKTLEKIAGSPSVLDSCIWRSGQMDIPRRWFPAILHCRSLTGMSQSPACTQGRKRMTLTYPISIKRPADSVVATGSEKAKARPTSQR